MLILSSTQAGVLENLGLCKSHSIPGQQLFATLLLGDLFPKHTTVCCSYFSTGKGSCALSQDELQRQPVLCHSTPLGSSGRIAKTRVKHIWDQKSPLLSRVPRGAGVSSLSRLLSVISWQNTSGEGRGLCDQLSSPLNTSDVFSLFITHKMSILHLWDLQSNTPTSTSLWLKTVLG
jgi:hypothetical protein